MTGRGRNFGRISGFKNPFVTLYHAAVTAQPGSETQSFLPRDLLTPPYRVTRPFCRFDAASNRIAFDLDGREVWVNRDQVALEKGDLAARGQALVVSVTLRSVRRVKIWYGPSPEEEADAGYIGLKVKPLRLVVVTLLAILGYLAAGQSDPLGALSAADNYSDVLYQQIYRAANYDRVTASGSEYPAYGPKPPRVVVVELLEEDLELFEENWPVGYDFHAWVLDRLSEREPAAVFVDIAFIDDRSFEGDDWEEELEEEEARKEAGTWDDSDVQRFFRAASASLGDSVASYRHEKGIPLFFAATPCFLPFFLPEDVTEGAGTRAVDVPGGRFHRQGTRYPLWNYQDGRQRCLRDVEQPSSALELQRELSGETEAGAPEDEETAEAKEVDLTLRRGKDEAGNMEVFARGLPSAACGVFDAVRGLASVNYGTDVCADKVLENSEVDFLNLHWTTRSFEMPLADGTIVPRNGRYACRDLPDHWLARLRMLVKEYDKDPLFEFKSPLRQICPPVRSYRVAEILNDGATREDLEGAIVIYAQNLTGLADSFRPPAHWPLNGAYFHAMAIDNLLTYRGPEKLIAKNEIWGISSKLILTLLGFVAVVPIWEYGLMLLARVERAGETARTRATAFRFYGIWVAGGLLLPLLAAVVVIELILVTTFLFPGAALNFVGLLSLIAVRSIPRLWRLIPPIWLGLGGWGKPPPDGVSR